MQSADVGDANAPPPGRLSLARLAWRLLGADRAATAGLALAVVLTLLPAGLLVVESSGAASDLRRAVAASAGVTVQRTGVGTPQAFDAFQGRAAGLVGPTLATY